MKSETLRIRVTELGLTKVDLTFGADAVDHLPNLIPQHLKQKLAERSIDLAALAERTRQMGHLPGTLFALEEKAKKVEVWLE